MVDECLELFFVEHLDRFYAESEEFHVLLFELELFFADKVLPALSISPYISLHDLYDWRVLQYFKESVNRQKVIKSFQFWESMIDLGQIDPVILSFKLS